MRGHSYLFSRSLRIHSIFRAALPFACLVAPRPAPRPVERGVMSPPALRLASRAVGRAARPVFRLACPSRLLLAPLGFPSSWFSRIASPPRVPSLPAYRPANRVEQAGRHRLACLPLSCGEVLLRSASLPLSCGVSLLAWLGAVLAYLNAFLGNFLKTCLGNSLNTAKHVPISICPPRLSAVASPYAAACCFAVLFHLRFELVKTARFPNSVSSRLAPRPVMRHARHPPRAFIRPFLPLIAIRLCSPTLLAHRAASSNAPPNRHARRGEKRGGRLLDGFVLYDFMLFYMPGILVIYPAFLLYISHFCYTSGVPVIYFAFLLYIGRSCYMTGILVISLIQSCVPSLSPLSCVAF